ncbi:MAG TPA: hypothetical protein PKH07_08250, partial [bacterium]|nr:hypothetical protein [bacterium]
LGNVPLNHMTATAVVEMNVQGTVAGVMIAPGMVAGVDVRREAVVTVSQTDVALEEDSIEPGVGRRGDFPFPPEVLISCDAYWNQKTSPL